MRSDILNLFKEKKENIGAFCGYLKSKNGLKHKEYINKVIHTELVDESMSIKLYYFINEIKKPLNCDCGKHRSYIGFKNGFRSTCGDKKCYVKKRKETCLDKYGVEHPNQNKDVKEKFKQTCLEKYGVKQRNLRKGTS